MRIVVNGRFYAARPTGVQRVAGELVARVCPRADVALHVPRGCRVPDAVRARAASVHRGLLRGAAWEQVELPRRSPRGVVRLDPANAGPVHGERRVLVLQDVFPISHPDWYRPAFRRWFRWVVAPSARAAEAVLMGTEWTRREAVRVLGLDPARVHVLPQGVEPFHEPASPEAVKRTLERLGIHRPFLLAAGSGDARKNDAFLIDVLARLRSETGSAPTLVVVGKGYGHVHGRYRVGDSGLHVQRPGFVTDDELHALYTAAQAFCFPSRAEGFGRPPLEAMACGAPVVSADYGCAREILGDAATVLPLDVEAWAEALAEVMAEDDEARARRGAASRAHAAAFRWDSAVERLLDVCREIAERPATMVAASSAPGRR